MHHRCLAVCVPGLEQLCADELAGLGVRIRRAFVGGVEFGASDRQLYAANLWLRTATRVVVRVATFRASTFDVLEREAASVDWRRWVGEQRGVRVRVSATASRLPHTGGVADRVAASAGAPAADDGLLVVVRVVHDRVMISVDSSGEPLDRRGWRLQTAKAPLRETVAAGLVLASGWDRTAPLVDPFCGSGTVAIEAALLAAGRPPGEGREFAFQAWPNFAPGTWASVLGDARRRVGPATPAPILACDRDAGAVDAAVRNAERAGVAALVEIRRRALSAVDPPPSLRGWLVTNPPYGRRVGGGDLRNLYASLGSLARERFTGWTVALLAADRRLAGHSGLPLRPVLRTDNGGIPVEVLVAGPLG